MGRGRTQDCVECCKLLLGQQGIHSPSAPRLHVSVCGSFCLPYGKNRAENRHLLKETGILDSLFRSCGTRWGSTVVLTVIVSRTHHFADSKPDQMRSVKITRPEAQFFDFASSQRVSVSTLHVRSIARRSGAGARYIVRQDSSRPSWGCCTSARARYAPVTHVAAGT